MDIVLVEDPNPPCSAERPFGPCTQRCEQPTRHDGPHRAQCFTWGDDWWAQTDEHGETIAAVSTAERIDLAAVETPAIVDDRLVALFRDGYYHVVREES